MKGRNTMPFDLRVCLHPFLVQQHMAQDMKNAVQLGINERHVLLSLFGSVR